MASSKDFAPIDQHVAPVKRFTFPGAEGESEDASNSSKVEQEQSEAAKTDEARVEHHTPASEAPAPQIDPELIRAEVIAAVKSLLPAIVNSYLKKLIQLEVKPQLQKWVDTRVASLINKMNDHDND